MSRDAWADFLGAMAAAGIRTPDKITGDGKLQRFYVEGDKKGSKNGWLTFHPDAPESGAFGSYRLGLQQTWTIDKPERLTDEQRDILRARMDRMRAERAAETARAHELARTAAAAILAACGPADPAHPYLVAKGISGIPGARQLKTDVRYEVADDERPKRTAKAGVLVNPIKGADGTLHSVQTISADGTKHFIKGTNKTGHYHSIGKLTPQIIIAEGFSTAGTIHLATGCCTVIAFDSGNLMAVAKAIKRKYPAHEIVMGADNDRLTMKPVPNPGMTKACEAAATVDGLVAWPEFEREAELPGGGTPTDFNDLATVRGNLESVAACFAAAQRPENIENHTDPRRHAEREATRMESMQVQETETPAPEPEPDEQDRSRSMSVVKHLCVGFEAGPVFYFKSARNGLIISATAGELGKNKFLSIADLRFWEDAFPSKQGADWTAATNAMIDECSKYDYEPSAITGRGVYLDAGRVVLHLGNKLVIDGGPNEPRMSLEVEDSERIYERRARIKLKPCKPLDPNLGARLVECLDLLPWSSSDMSRIFAGWLAVAPICGMLTWRPHLWVVGPAGSGKSWILKHVATAILGKLAVRFQGAATEAGVRQVLERDALPVIFDEAESQNEDSRRRLQLIVDMARQSSSEDAGDIVKGGQNGKPHRFRLQSTFLFSSINLGADQAADLSRIITLSLEGPQPHASPIEKKERRERFDYIKRKFAEVIQDDFGPRMFARSLRLAKTIRANAEMLAAVIAENADNQRVSDTVALPMAGWYSLISDALLTRDAARKLITEHTWALDVAERNETESDHDKAVAHLLDQKIRVSPMREESVAALIWKASAGMAGRIERSADEAAHQALINMGIRVVPGSTSNGYASVMLASSHSELARYFDKGPWAKSWAQCIAQHPRCMKMGSMKFGNATKRALAFNLDDLGVTGDEVG